jgi:hypothetical protein
MSTRTPPVGENLRDDLVQLLESLNDDLMAELGKPSRGRAPPQKTRAGSCPATHNRLLFDRGENQDGG